MIRLLKKLGPEFCVFVLGSACVGAGAWWVYPPAGVIVVGLLLLGDIFCGRIMKFKIEMKKGGDS